jgi:hypothetical protein
MSASLARSICSSTACSDGRRATLVASACGSICWHQDARASRIAAVLNAKSQGKVFIPQFPIPASLRKR